MLRFMNMPRRFYEEPASGGEGPSLNTAGASGTRLGVPERISFIVAAWARHLWYPG